MSAFYDLENIDFCFDHDIVESGLDIPSVQLNADHVNRANAFGSPSSIQLM